MDERLKALIAAYAGITVTDVVAKTLKLNSLYLKAKKSCTKLKYRSGLMSSNKKYLRFPLSMHIFALLNLCSISLVPVLNIRSTENLYKDDNLFFDEYLNMFNSIYEDINKCEEEERSYVAKFLSQMYSTYSEYLPESYMGHRLDDETIRISRKEMIKFLRKNGIILEEKNVSDDGIDYAVYVLKK